MSASQKHPLAGQFAPRLAPDHVRPEHPVRVVPVDVAAVEQAIGGAPPTIWELAAGASNGRVNGLANKNAVFGWTPPTPVRRRDFCGACRPNRLAPALMLALAEIAQRLDSALRNEAPNAWAHLHELAAGIGPDWRFPGTGWTSAIINDTAALPYHKDGGNTAGSWSAMAVVRRGVEGGHLHLPDVDLTVPCDHGTAVLFSGQQHLHGVTPFRRRTPRAYRYTIVFYQRSLMNNCGSPAEELRKQHQKRTEREHVMADPNHRLER